MNMMRKILPLALLLAVSSVHTAVAASKNKVAQKYIEVAIVNCERGLTMDMPLSGVGLKVLQRYQNKYQSYREAAQAAAPGIESSAERYDSEYFTGKTYPEIFSACDSKLADKVKKTEDYIRRREAENKNRARQMLDTQAQRSEAAKNEIAAALKTYCAGYLTPPDSPASLTPDAEGKLGLDKTTYRIFVQKALGIDPNVGTQTLSGQIRGTGGKGTQTVTQSINEWLNYCDQVFEDYGTVLAELRRKQKEQADAVVIEAPATEPPPEDEKDAPPEDEPLPEDEKDAPPEDDAAAADEDAEFLKEFRAAVKGDRIKVLDEQGKVPDSSDNEDEPEKANVWRFENENGDRCTVYTFKGNQLTGPPKVLKRECPFE